MPAGAGAAASNSDFPAASAARRRADAIGSARGLRGCQEIAWRIGLVRSSRRFLSAPENAGLACTQARAASTQIRAAAPVHASTYSEDNDGQQYWTVAVERARA
jgi:hypothetical protein